MFSLYYSYNYGLLLFMTYMTDVTNGGSNPDLWYIIVDFILYINI